MIKKPTKKYVGFIFNNRPSPEVIKELRKSYPDHLAEIDKMAPDTWCAAWKRSIGVALTLIPEPPPPE